MKYIIKIKWTSGKPDYLIGFKDYRFSEDIKKSFKSNLSIARTNLDFVRTILNPVRTHIIIREI